MGVMTWVQTKLIGRKQEKRRSKAMASSSCHPPTKEVNYRQDFSEWAEGLLAIGTIGNAQVKEEQQIDGSLESSYFAEHVPDFTIEELIKLKRELHKLLKHKPKSNPDGSEKGTQIVDLPLNGFLDCPSTLELGCRARPGSTVEEGVNGSDLSPYSRVILGKATELLTKNRNAIKQKSVSFLVKKMFACRGGFSTGPSLRDPVPDLKMEKLLRLILHKKIHQPNSAPMSSIKKYLTEKVTEKEKARNDNQEMEENQGEWVKTDSDFIVLEMRHHPLKY